MWISKKKAELIKKDAVEEYMRNRDLYERIERLEREKRELQYKVERLEHIVYSKSAEKVDVPVCAGL